MFQSVASQICVPQRLGEIVSHIELESTLPGRESGQIIVLGMHRSGTSCLTGALALAGAYVGEESAQMQAGAQNPKGFFERRDLRNYCDTLLMEAGADWWKLSSFSPDQINPATKWKAESFAKPAFTEMEEHRPWIAKEPRFCVLLPSLRDLLPDPVCMHIVRNPLEVARSLRERNGIPIQQGISLWEFYNQSAIRGSKGLRVIRVGYEQLLQDPAQIVGQLLVKLRAFGVAGLTEPGGEEIRDFVDVSLHRQVADSGGEDAYLTKSQRQLWRLLQSDRELKSKDLPAMPESTLVALQDLEFAKLNADRIPQLEKALKDQRVSERETSRALMKANDQLQALQNKLSATQEKLSARPRKNSARPRKNSARPRNSWCPSGMTFAMRAGTLRRLEANSHPPAGSWKNPCFRGGSFTRSFKRHRKNRESSARISNRACSLFRRNWPRLEVSLTQRGSRRPGA